jgi:RNA polymerase sigma-70 factor (ECF subfamily)
MRQHTIVAGRGQTGSLGAEVLIGRIAGRAKAFWSRGAAAVEPAAAAPLAPIAPLASSRPAWKQVDRPLIEACQHGDQAAFRELFDACQARVYSLARHFCGNDTTAKDIAQDVFLAVFQAIGQFRHEARFETWLYRIVVNACLKERRRRRTLVPFGEDGVTAVAPDQSRESAMVRREVAAEVRAAVATLRPKLRMPLLLKHVEGLSYDEIAAVLGCSTGTVASRLNRARTALAGKLSHLRGASAGD